MPRPDPIFDRLGPSDRVVPMTRKAMSLTRLGTTTRTSMRLLEHRAPEVLSSVVEELVYELEAYCLTDHLAPSGKEITFTVQVPATWWQHLKRDRARDWVLRRWPVRYREITATETVRFERDALYPQANVPLPPEFGKPIIIERMYRE